MAGLEDRIRQVAAAPKSTSSRTDSAASRNPVTTTNPVVDPVVDPIDPVDPIVEPKLVSTYTDPETGDIIDVYDDKTEVVRKKGRVKLDAAAAADALAAEKLAERVSAYDILYSQFKDLGLESLVEDVKESIIKSQSKSERTLALRSSDNYKKRFAGNKKRVDNGFAAIDEATYLALEDSYQALLQNYGMPEKYYKRGDLGVQEYLEQAISNNVDPTTFEDRIIAGQKVLNANKAVLDAAKEFYPTLTDGDFLDYVLNTENALPDIQRKVTAAEIGGAQLNAGFNFGKTPQEIAAAKANAEELAKAGVTGAKYQASAADIAEASIRGGQLSSIYKQDPYTQQTAEAAVLNTPGSAEAVKQTKKLTALEQAKFSGQAGRGVLARERAGSI